MVSSRLTRDCRQSAGRGHDEAAEGHPTRHEQTASCRQSYQQSTAAIMVSEADVDKMKVRVPCSHRSVQGVRDLAGRILDMWQVLGLQSLQFVLDFFECSAVPCSHDGLYSPLLKFSCRWRTSKNT